MSWKISVFAALFISVTAGNVRAQDSVATADSATVGQIAFVQSTLNKLAMILAFEALDADTLMIFTGNVEDYIKFGDLSLMFDPWSQPYSCIVETADSCNVRIITVIVLSGGPDGVRETSDDVLTTGLVLGDDFGFRLTTDEVVDKEQPARDAAERKP